MAKWIRGSKLPSARTSTCSINSATCDGPVSSVGTITMVRASSGIPAWRSSRGRRRGGARRAANL
jgi:hypothetical protein